MFKVKPEDQQTVRAALKRSGGITKWARRFQIARTSIYEWVEKGEVPADRAVTIERESGGVAQRQELRPADFWKWWPDLPPPGSLALTQPRIGARVKQRIRTIYMNYCEALEADITREQALREVRLHDADCEQFLRELGEREYYSGAEVLAWLGY